jgi:hypothetical protein
MPWYRKEQPTPFDASTIPGLEFLHGDILAKQYKQPWVEGKKYPLITFPSGLKRELWESFEQGRGSLVHIFGELELPYKSTSDEAYEAVQADPHGYLVRQASEHAVFIGNPRSRRAYVISYDNAAGQMIDITHYPKEAMELLGGEQRALLPELYANEKLGLEAVAPLKFFTPDSNWYWYPTEFDGKDIFFGLVSGFEVELGYFSLSELESVRGVLGLPIERDLYFEPTTLKALKALHQRGHS